MQHVWIVICLFTVWIPLIRDTSSHSFIENQRSNVTQLSSTISVDVGCDFKGESLMKLVVTLCCAGAAIFSIGSHSIKTDHPAIESFNCRRLLIPLIFASIFNQMVTGLVTRPLEVISDFRFQSILLFQIIGFFVALFSAFIFGVLYVGYPGVVFTSDTHQTARAETDE